MDLLKQQLFIEQIDRKLSLFKHLDSISVPQKGWINAIRNAIRMSMRQLGDRLSISPQSVKEIEERESNGSITLKNLKEVGAALDLKLIYGFIPKNQSIENMIEIQAMEIAKEIVLRTSASMQLENQGNTKERIEKAILNRAKEISFKMPKYLWELKSGS